MNPQDDVQDLEAASGMLEEMGAEPFDYSAPEGFDGGLEALKGFLRPSAGAGRTLLMAGAPFPILADKAESLVTGKETTANQEAYFSEVVEGLGGNAVEAWTPDPVTMSSTAKAINTVTNVAGSIPQMIGMTPLFLANAGVDPTVDLVDQGVDLPTAAGVGAVNFSVNALGMRLPAAFGTSLATRVATGAGSNLALGVAADATSAGVLDAGGYGNAAEGYDAADPYARGLDLLMGIAFGAKAHIDAPRLTPAQGDAILVARNADHIERGTMPGTPLTKGAEIQSQNALTTAVRQVLAGDRVNVADSIRLEDFLLKPGFAGVEASRMQGAGFEAAVADVLKTEGGYVNNPADTGGETKFGISAKNNPGVDIANLTQDQARAIYKTKYWDLIGADKLPASIQGTAFDAAVNQGVPWTRQALAKAGGDAGKFNDLREARYRSIVQRDPTQAQFLKGWLNRLGKFVDQRAAFNEGGTSVSVDQLQGGREYTTADQTLRAGANGVGPRRDPLDVRDNGDGTFAVIDGNGTLSAARDMGWQEVPVRTTRAATERTDELAALTDIPESTRAALADHFEHAAAVKPRFDAAVKGIAQEVGGVAKLSDIKGAVRSAAKAVSDYAGDARKIKDLVRATINVDSSGKADAAVAQAVAKINGRVKRNALSADSQATSEVGYRDALIVGEIDGHPVELQVNFPEMLAAKKKAHKLYAEQTEIERSVPAGQKPTPEQQARLTELMAQQRAIYEPAWAAVKLRNASSDTSVALRENESSGKGRPAGTSQAVQTKSGDLDTGTSSTSANRVPVGNDAGSAMRDMGGSSEGIVAETPIQAASRLSDENPELTVIDGFDGDGNPRYRPMADAIVDIERERQQAVRDADGIAAAVNCTIRRGPDAT